EIDTRPKRATQLERGPGFIARLAESQYVHARFASREKPERRSRARLDGRYGAVREQERQPSISECSPLHHRCRTPQRPKGLPPTSCFLPDRRLAAYQPLWTRASSPR